MSQERKDSNARCDNDVLKPIYQMQSEETENRSANSRGTSVSQGAYKTNSILDDCCQGNKENKTDDRRVLLAITVEIEDGCVEHIEMKEGDFAEAVAMKFCRDHNLPDQFVAPLTEHIVSNIISISKEDKDIVFCSKDECASYEENWPCKEAQISQGHHERHCEQQSSSASFGGNNRAAKKRLAASEKENNYFHKSQKSPLTEKSKSNVLQRKVSDRLIAPTFTSLAKTGNLDVREKPKPYTPRPNPEQAKAVYMHLYTEHMRQREKQEEDKKRSFERYQEKIDKNRMNVPKKSWRIMLMRGRIAKKYQNYGELLYTEGVTKKETQQKLIEKKQKDDEVRELSEFTGIPEIRLVH